MQNENDILTQEHIEEYAAHLREQERAENTVQKYRSDLAALRRWLGGRPLAKLVLIQWKEHLALTYAATSVNSMLAALNGLLQFMGRGEMAVKPLRIQKRLFCDEGRELTKKEYVRLVETARGEGNERLALVLQTLCATGIRVSELPYITAKAVRLGRAEVSNKGKNRTVFLPEKLRKALLQYARAQKIAAGPVFVTRNGKPLDRSNIFHSMKKLCDDAGVNKDKVFPHNLRHLFATVFYNIKRDIAKLADVLGHSNIETTRIYIKTTGREHRKLLNQMKLVLETEYGREPEPVCCW